MARENDEGACDMTITYKTTFQQAQEMFAAAATQGPTAIDTHLRALAFSLGAQAVFGTHPEAMPDVVNDLSQSSAMASKRQCRRPTVSSHRRTGWKSMQLT